MHERSASGSKGGQKSLGRVNRLRAVHQKVGGRVKGEEKKETKLPFHEDPVIGMLARSRSGVYIQGKR